MINLGLAFVLLVAAIGRNNAETVEDDMVIIEADNRQGRQFVTLEARLAGLPLGLFRESGIPDLNQPCVTKEGLFGTCMTINQCYPERKIFRTEAKDTWIFGLYNTCSYNSPKGKQVFGVCCAKSMVAQIPRQPEQNEVEDIPANKNLAQRDCNPMPTNYQCTYDGRRIVNGVEAAKNAYPFMAALMRVSSYSSTPRQFCGGSLIDESHVLTAAHCIEGLSASDVKTLRVFLGAHDIKNQASQRSEHRVIRIIKHKDFSSTTLVNDIAILTLETPASISGSIKTVCLPTVDYDYTGERVTVSGWGALSEGGGQPATLHEVEVKVWTNAQCKAQYDHRIPGKIEDSMICAAESNKDSCSGDSGGPLYMKRNGVCVQLGIVSWGIGCARPDSPGVYTRVTKMMDWIRRIQNCY